MTTILCFACLAAAFGGEPGREAVPVVRQEKIGENACGPCAVLNSLLHGGKPYRAVAAELEGEDLEGKVRGLIARYGRRPSEAYGKDRARYLEKEGITWVDLTAFFGELLKDHDLPPLSGSYLDRRKDETLDAHLRRVHGLLAESLRSGVPVVTSVRSFAPKMDETGNKYSWAGLVGHYVTIVEVQDRIAEEEKGFRMAYTDSYTGRIDRGYVYYDEARNFTAAKGDAKKWTWLSDRPFLVLAAPSLRLKTQAQAWYLRTTIILNYAVHAVSRSPEEAGSPVPADGGQGRNVRDGQ